MNVSNEYVHTHIHGTHMTALFYRDVKLLGYEIYSGQKAIGGS